MGEAYGDELRDGYPELADAGIGFFFVGHLRGDGDQVPARLERQAAGWSP